jgi:hypothetical protein
VENAKQAEIEALEARLNTVKADLEKALQERSRAVKQKEKLETQLAALTKKRNAREELSGAKKAEKAAGGGPGLSVPFGKWAELDAIKNANWPEMAGAVANMNEMFLDLVELIDQDQPVDPEIQDRIRKENNKLVRYAAQIMGKIPTNSPINGEFSHPITTANLMSAMLDRAGMPLTGEQKAEMAQIGTEYESEYKKLQGEYTEDTVRLAKLVDEMELKRDTVNAMQELLTDEQQGTLIHPSIHHRSQIDVLSPYTMATLLSGPRQFPSREELRGQLSGLITGHLKIDPEQSGSIDPILDNWLKDLDPILTPVQKPDKLLHIDQAIVAGQAQARALQELLKLPNLSENSRTAILSDVSWRVPQIVVKPEKSETPETPGTTG